MKAGISHLKNLKYFGGGRKLDGIFIDRGSGARVGTGKIRARVFVAGLYIDGGQTIAQWKSAYWEFNERDEAPLRNPKELTDDQILAFCKSLVPYEIKTTHLPYAEHTYAPYVTRGKGPALYRPPIDSNVSTGNIRRATLTVYAPQK